MFAWSASLGAHIWKGSDAWLNQHIFKVIPNDGICKRYLYYYLLYIVADLYGKTHGSGMVHITKAPFMNTPIPVPDYPEQRRIVSRIEELLSQLDSGVETLNMVKRQLLAYRQAVYSSMYHDFQVFAPIIEFFDISSGLTKNSKRNAFPVTMPYLRVANVYYNSLDLGEIKTIGVRKEEIPKTLLKKDDLLFVEGNGSKSQIGRVAIWDGSVKDCLHQNHIIKGRSIGGMLPKFALYYLISQYGRKQILAVASSTSGLYTLSANKIRNLSVPVCNLERQSECVAQIEKRLSICDNIEQTVAAALRQSEAMRQSILKRAFEENLL